ncbi:MAG: hypothetical protein HOE80_04240 [Candidatus Magasanikbacteria bacterium]|jgi:hypothetical protein|nr:hypothetical protein [Candidatus Magasanikbacteria bacterium]MBT4071903.1 hypothetical protein [Candidatus Magasanikbacteria bacterium]
MKRVLVAILFSLVFIPAVSLAVTWDSKMTKGSILSSRTFTYCPIILDNDSCSDKLERMGLCKKKESLKKDLFCVDYVDRRIPRVVDTDSDSVPDGRDNCRNTFNPDQSDVDNDGIGDMCDIDNQCRQQAFCSGLDVVRFVSDRNGECVQDIEVCMNGFACDTRTVACEPYPALNK